MSRELQSRAVKAAAKYVEMKGYELVGIDEPFLAWFEDDTMVVCRVKASTTKFPKGKERRSSYEKMMAKFTAMTNRIGFMVRFDRIDLHVVSDDRACLRHEQDVQDFA